MKTIEEIKIQNENNKIAYEDLYEYIAFRTPLTEIQYTDKDFETLINLF